MRAAASLSKHGSIAALGGIHQRLMPSAAPPPGRDLGRSRRARTTLRSLPSGLCLVFRVRLGAMVSAQRTPLGHSPPALDPLNGSDGRVPGYRPGCQCLPRSAQGSVFRKHLEWIASYNALAAASVHLACSRGAKWGAIIGRHGHSADGQRRHRRRPPGCRRRVLHRARHGAGMQGQVEGRWAADEP
jgi:hypothetical protein